MVKWCDLFQGSMEAWRPFFRSCFWCIKDNRLIWFQYRIIYKLLGTREYLYKLKISDTDKCHFCNEESESITHMFALCPKVKDIWEVLKNWIRNVLKVAINFNSCTLILGYTNQDKNFWPLNFVLMCTRFYIFSSSRKKNQLNFHQLQNVIKSIYDEQKQLATINSTLFKFDKMWCEWKYLFRNITG